MSLENIHRRSQISKTTVYRVLKALVHLGNLAQSQDGLYRRPISNPRKIVFGYGCQSTEMPFSEAVTKSLKAAASDTYWCGPAGAR